MSKNEKIFLEGRIPIRLIQKPFCKKCKDIVNQGEKMCYNCKNTLPIVKDWYFNKVKCIGIYHSYDNDIGNSSYKIPINLLSELIYLLKFKKGPNFKEYAGKLIADGFFQIITGNPEIFRNIKYITTSPKYDKSEKNQCEFIIKPLLEKMRRNGFDVENILNRTERLRNVGENKDKGLEERFNDISGVHNIVGEDFNGKKVLIIEDIYTTGSTVWDLARALRDKNAGEINVLVAGRSRSCSSWKVSEDLDFNELILYFSKLDYDRVPRTINDVKIINLESQDNNITATFKGSETDYHLSIDYKKKVIKHNCSDFILKRIKNKKFCKHLTKIFIDLLKHKDKMDVKNLLNLIYLSLDKWEFKEF